MKNRVIFYLIFAGFMFINNNIYAQEQDENNLLISGKLMTDQRFLLKNNNDWAWNENRLTLNLDKKVSNKSKFRSEIWLRNIGLPSIADMSDIYNKGIIDPYNIEIREANLKINDFLLKNLDLCVGRQFISWGTADKLNPTDNLNPLDMEDIIDFGRKRGTDAFNFQYYINNDFSLQGVYVPFFRPANLPVGIFANVLNSNAADNQTLQNTGYVVTMNMPQYNLGESSIAGFKFKGFEKGVDFSLSYIWGYEGLPVNIKNTFVPVDTIYDKMAYSEMSYFRTHIFGADLATDVAGVGLWAEAALFMPENDVVMTNNLTALYPLSTQPVINKDTLLKKKEPYLKFIIGGDYFFRDGSYINLQYMHGFFHEMGNENLNDYFFVQYEKKFFNEKLKIAPVGGGLVIEDWKDAKDNYALIYKPEITYKASENTDITLSTVIFNGKGDNLFSGLKDYSMFLFKLNYSF
ncbi:MAG: hypothetical protein Kow0068_14310 [Marinilabiliales bacterium]